ncbi:MAG: elongation factor P [Deltaproteobacteria bacterium]|nr:elongation factor P [Deltaproteobacteria bacterium]
MLDTTAIRKNLKVEIDGDPWIVVDFQFVKPGKGQAFTRTRLKNMISGQVVDKTYKSGEKIGESARIDERAMMFLYAQGDAYTFMDNENYEQIEMTEDQVGEAVKFLIDNINVEVLFYNDRPIGIELPNFVELQIAETEPAVKGDTVSGATKPATMSTGHVLNVPLFINTDEWLVVDTRTGEYVERVKK